MSFWALFRLMLSAGTLLAPILGALVTDALRYNRTACAPPQRGDGEPKRSHFFPPLVQSTRC